VKPRSTALVLALAFVLVGVALWASPWRWFGVVPVGVGVALAIYVLVGRLR
jgi:hypothetical protein